jgi:rod shape-determining protein MreC
MESFFVRYRNPLILVALVLAQVIGLASQIRRPVQGGGAENGGVRLARLWVIEVGSPFERVFHGIGHGIRGSLSGYLALRGVYKKNQDLQAEVNRLRLEQAGLAEDAIQGRRLQALLGFKEQYLAKTVAAQVLSTSGSDLSRALYIDKGSRSGIRPDMAVITPDGIVGKVREVFPDISQVLPINDPTSGAGVMLEKTRIRGVLRGDSIGQIEIINMLPDERVQPGERVVTTGGDQVYPRGLTVGWVDRVVPDPERDPYQAIILRPGANLSRLEEVLVITQTSEQEPASTSADVASSEQLAEAQKKAAEVLADKLPTVDPAVVAASVAQDEMERPPQPPQPIHNDRFAIGETPPATDMRPGVPPQAWVAEEKSNAPDTPVEAPAKPAAPKATTPPSAMGDLSAGKTVKGGEASATAGKAPATKATTAPKTASTTTTTGPKATATTAKPANAKPATEKKPPPANPPADTPSAPATTTPATQTNQGPQ